MSQITINNTIPVGTVVLWNNSKEIPTGWQKCDGTNGTPDLRSKFVVGAGNNYALNAQGGSTNIPIAQANIPANWPQLNDPEHAHSLTMQFHYQYVVGAGGPTDGFVLSGQTNYMPSKDQNVKSNLSITKGSGTQVPHTQPYCALYFIQKITN